MSEDEANRMIYEARLKAQRDEYSRIQGARREGWAIGWAKGIEEGLNMVLQLMKEGYSAEQIKAKLAAVESTGK